MPIDFSKFGNLADSIKQKVDAALKNDNKVSENEIKQMNLSKEVEKALREELSKNPGMYEDAFVVSKKDNNATHTLKLDKGKSEGPLTLSKDSIEYYKKQYPEAQISSAYLKNGVVYLQNKYGEQAIDSSGAPIKYSFGKEDSQKDSVSFINYYLEHNNGVFDLNQFNTISAIQNRLNQAPEVSETYYDLMNSIEFEEADDETKTKMLFEQAKTNLANATGVGEIMQNLFTCVMLDCQVLDYNLNIPEIREHFNEFFGLDKIADAARSIADDGNDEQLTSIEKAVSATIGSVKGAEAFVTSTQLLAFIGVLTAASVSAESIGLGEAFSIATTGLFGYEAGSMGIDAIVDGYHAKTSEEAEVAGEQFGAAALMMLGVAKGGKKVVDGFLENHSILETGEKSAFEFLKETLSTANTREKLIQAGEVIKKCTLSAEEKLELNKEFFKKSLEIQSNYSTIQKSIVNMHKGDVSPKIIERNNMIRARIQKAIDNHETLTLKKIAEDCSAEGCQMSVGDVQNSIYSERFGLKLLFEQVNSRSKSKGENAAEVVDRVVPDELKEIAETQPDFYDSVVDIKNPDGTQFYSVEEIKILAEESKRMPGFVRTLTNQKNADGTPRFTGKQIRNIIQLYFKEPDMVKQLVYTELSEGKTANGTAYKYSAECIETIAQVFENGTTNKKVTARKMLKDNPNAFPNGEVPENPSEVIIQTLRRNRGRQPKTVEQANDNGSAQVVSISDSKGTSNASKYEFKEPKWGTSPADLKSEARGTYDKVFDIGQKRLFNYIQNLPPKAEITEPIVVTVGNNHFGFTVKKTLDNKVLVTVKNWLGDKASWDKPARVEQTLTIEMDENYNMTSGKLSWNNYYESKEKFEYSYTYEQNQNGAGIITYKKDYYGQKERFRTEAEPLDTRTEVFEQSPDNPALWLPKFELDQARDAKTWDFNLSDGSIDMISEAFSYKPEEAGMRNLFLNFARNGKEVQADSKAAFKMSEAQQEGNTGGVALKQKTKPVETDRTQGSDNTQASVAVVGTDYEYKYPPRDSKIKVLKAEAEKTKREAFDKLNELLPDIIKNVPKGEAMDKPVIIQVGVNRIGIFVDKSRTGGNTTNVIIKHWVGDKPSWENPNFGAEQTLQYKIDRNGKLLKAYVHWIEKYDGEGDRSTQKYIYNSTEDGNILISHREEYYPDKHYETPLWVRDSGYEPSSENGIKFDCTTGNARVTETSIAFDENESNLFNTFMGLFKPENLNKSEGFTTTKKPAVETEVGKTDTAPKTDTTSETETPQAVQTETPKAEQTEQPKPQRKSEEEIQVRKAAAAEKLRQDTETTVAKLNSMNYKERMSYMRQKEGELLEKTKQKIQSYLQLIKGSGKMNEPVLVNVDGYFRLKFQIDQNQEGKTVVNVEKGTQKLSFVLDEDGQMVSAKLYQGQHTTSFFRGAHGVRRLFFGGVEYQPVGSTKGEWAPVRGRLQNEQTAKKYLKADDNDLFKLMLDLGELKTYLK